MQKLLDALLCFFGIHEWDGHADLDFYPAPQCKRCGKWYGGHPTSFT